MMSIIILFLSCHSFSSFCLNIILSFCHSLFSLSIFLSFCLSVLVCLSSFFQFNSFHISSSQFAWKPSESFFIVFLYFCLSVISLSSFIQFISFHISSLQFAWKPSESFLLYFHIFVFLSFSPSVFLSLRLVSSSQFIFISPQFILVHGWSSWQQLRPVQFVLRLCGMNGWDGHHRSLAF